MDLLSSVTSAAVTLTAGLDPATTSKPSTGRAPGAAGGLASARTPDALTAMLDAGTASAKGAATKGAKASGASGAKSTTKTTARTTGGTTTSASSGYAKAAASDGFAFLKDPKLSVEEKLFQFMCAVARRNDDEVLKKMNEMKGGTAAGAAGSSSSSGAKKPAATSVWSALKALIPPLGLAAQLVGDAKLKAMITQVSGPVLAAAVTALGMPALAPLALKAGPDLASAIMNGKLGGGEAAAAADGASTSGASSTAAATSSSTAKNEQVQLMELQRLIDKQKEMFAMVSNILRAQHDTRMAIVGNVR